HGCGLWRNWSRAPDHADSRDLHSGIFRERRRRARTALRQVPVGRRERCSSVQQARRPDHGRSLLSALLGPFDAHMLLPAFKYHPDPIATGSIEAKNINCVCCEQDREYVYTGPVYAEADLNDKLCPWCIENGLAHKKYGAEFTDRASIGGYDNSAGKMVSQEIMYEIAYRTPGFIGWQQSQWLAHCGDGCKFLGLAGKREIEA